MNKSEDRKSKVSAFYDVARRHSLVALSCAINISELRKAKSRIFIPNTIIEWGFLDNPFLVCFRCLMDFFHANRHMAASHLPLNLPIEFIFDDQSEKGVVLEMWDEYIGNRPSDVRNLYGSAPRFENDKVYLPLQAADLWAGHIRKWKEEGILHEKMLELSTGLPIEQSERLAINIDFDEEAIVKHIKLELSDMTDMLIYDVTFSPVPEI